MAADYVLPDETIAPRRFEKGMKIFIFLGLLGLAAELVWLVGVSPFRPLSRIDVSGSESTGRDLILQTAGISSSTTYFSADAHAMEKALAGLSALRSAQVFKRFPDRLQIVIEERRAAACTLVSLNGRTVPLIFDSQGVVFRVGSDELLRQMPVLPLVSGLIIEDPVEGMRLPPMFIPLFRELEKIRNSAPELLEAISELRVNPKPYEGFDLLLYPVHRRVKVRLSELNEDLLRYTLLMVDVLASKEPGIENLDFRSGIASYIPKEAP